MQDMKNFLSCFLLAAIFGQVISQGHVVVQIVPPDRLCGVTYAPYRLDNEPESVGLAVGEYEPEKMAYVGLGSWQKMALNAGRVQIDPPGVKLIFNGGTSILNNELGSIYFLRPRRGQEFMWVPSQYGEPHRFAVDFGTNSSGTPHYFGRMVKNGFVYMGIVPLYMGKLFYVDENERFVETATGYEILVCGTTRVERPVMPPPASDLPNYDTGCIHNWVPFNNDNAPARNGVESGEYDIDEMGYVGKGHSQPGPWRPGRIELNTGLHLLHKGAEFLETNNTFYLADNPRYTYKWVVFDGVLPNNSVKVHQPIGHMSFSVTRHKINGRYNVGMFMGKESYFPSEDGLSSGFFDFYEVLTCDPVPRYKCNPTWKRYALDDEPSIHGLEAGTINGVPSYIGRGIKNCNLNCSHNIGRIQVSPSSEAGVYYANDIFTDQVFDNTTGEYLLRNANNSYIWALSGDGVLVRNAIEIDDGVDQPSYIGKIEIDSDTFIGKVKPGIGLYYVNTDGEIQLSSSYAVLTCFSPNSPNGS